MHLVKYESFQDFDEIHGHILSSGLIVSLFLGNRDIYANILARLWKAPFYYCSVVSILSYLTDQNIDSQIRHFQGHYVSLVPTVYNIRGPIR
jgi:hypothetical protein